MSENQSQALVLSDGKSLVKYSESAYETKTRILEKSALIGNRITTPEKQAVAAAALAEINGMLKRVEDARVQTKKPALEFGTKVDAEAKIFANELAREKIRIMTALSNFQAQEHQRMLAQQQAENERLAEIERQRAREMAKAPTMEAADKIREEYAEKARAEAPQILAPRKAEGMSSKADWDVEVFDINLLYRAHPVCVKMEPLVSEIKNLIKAGVTEIKGVRFKPKISVSVRGKNESPPIDV